MLDYKKIKNERQWKSSTGLSEAQFMQLAKHFKETYESIKGYCLQDLAEKNKITLLLNSYEDCLFFVLFQLKNCLSYDALGLLIHTDGSNAQRNYENSLKILEHTLEKQGVMPSRSFKDIAEFKACIGKETEIILDGSEQATQRPSEAQEQKSFYSGGPPQRQKKVIPINNL